MDSLDLDLTTNGSAGNGHALESVACVGRAAGLDLATLLPSGRARGLSAEGAPEVAQLTFGILPLVDCAPIVVAREKGFFAKYGIEATIGKSASWTALRDALNTGALHAAHMLFGMPVGAAVGKLGTDQKPLIIPWILSRNGQAITLAAKYRGKIAADSEALRPLAHESRDSGRPLVFGITLAPGTHAMWLRYWLAAGGIHPDKDVALITVPPPQMAANMKTGRMDGFCVGEPWNARAIADGVGFTAICSEEIGPDHPEKVLAFTEEFSEAHPRAVKAVLKDGGEPRPREHAHGAGDHQSRADDRQHRSPRNRREIHHPPVQRDGLAALRQRDQTARRPQFHRRRRQRKNRRYPRDRGKRDLAAKLVGLRRNRGRHPRREDQGPVGHRDERLALLDQSR